MLISTLRFCLEKDLVYPSDYTCVCTYNRTKEVKWKAGFWLIFSQINAMFNTHRINNLTTTCIFFFLSIQTLSKTFYAQIFFNIVKDEEKKYDCLNTLTYSQPECGNNPLPLVQTKCHCIFVVQEQENSQEIPLVCCNTSNSENQSLGRPISWVILRIDRIFLSLCLCCC